MVEFDPITTFDGIYMFGLFPGVSWHRLEHKMRRLDMQGPQRQRLLPVYHIAEFDSPRAHLRLLPLDRVHAVPEELGAIQVVELETWIGSPHYSRGDLLYLQRADDFVGDGDYLFIYRGEVWLTRVWDGDFCYMIMNHQDRPLALPYPDTPIDALRQQERFDPQLRFFARVMGCHFAGSEAGEGA